MTDDIDASYRIVTTAPIKSGFCQVCGMWMKGFAQCPWCKGERKVVRKPRRWVGGREIR